MTATNMCSNFGGLRSSPPLVEIRTYLFLYINMGDGSSLIALEYLYLYLYHKEGKV